MEFKAVAPPRKFRVGLKSQIEISDCARIELEPDEQVTFVSSGTKEHDFAAKNWGFYATPSINGRLLAQGFKTALVSNSSNKLYIMVVDMDKLAEFEAYLQEEQQQVVEWLDERTK